MVELRQTMSTVVCAFQCGYLHCRSAVGARHAGEYQSEQLSEVVQGFDEQRRELFRLEQATRRRVEALMLEGGSDEEEARELLTRMTDLRAQEADLFAVEQTALLEVLSPIQVLQMQSFREQIGRRIRALGGGMGDQSGGRRRRGGPPGDGTLTPPWG